MLFDNFLADKEDRFYFMFAFAVRGWLSLLFIIFVPFLLIHFGYEMRLHQYLTGGASYLLMGFLDFSHVFIKALMEYRWKRWVDIQHNGLKTIDSLSQSAMTQAALCASILQWSRNF